MKKTIAAIVLTAIAVVGTAGVAQAGFKWNKEPVVTQGYKWI